MATIDPSPPPAHQERDQPSPGFRFGFSAWGWSKTIWRTIRDAFHQSSFLHSDLPNERSPLINSCTNPPSASLPRIHFSLPRLSPSLPLYLITFLSAWLASTIALAITHKSVLPSHSAWFNHRAALDLPLSYALLAVQLPFLAVLLATSHPGSSLPSPTQARTGPEFVSSSGRPTQARTGPEFVSSSAGQMISQLDETRSRRGTKLSSRVVLSWHFVKVASRQKIGSLPTSAQAPRWLEERIKQARASFEKVATFPLITYAVLCQLALLSIDNQLRRTESTLTILSVLWLLASALILALAVPFLYSDLPPSTLPSRDRSLTGLLVQKPSRYFPQLYLGAIACSVFLLSSKVFFMALDPSAVSRYGLVLISAPSSASAPHPGLPLDARVQLSCNWLNHPSAPPTHTYPTAPDADLPLSTKTIIPLSPSRHTSYHATRWIQDMKLNQNGAAGVRLCQFDRPGYNHSDNLPTSRISDAVSALEQALEVTGEIDLVKRYWGGLGASGFVLVGHGYGALEAKLFATRHPSLTKSMMYINPHSESTFFSTEKLSPSSFAGLLTWSTKNTYQILTASWTYTIKRYISVFSPVRNLLLGCHSSPRRRKQWSSLHDSLCAPVSPEAWTPSMARAVLQESFVAQSDLARQEMHEAGGSMPKSISSVVLASSRDSRGIAHSMPAVISTHLCEGGDYYHQPDDARLCIQAHSEICQSTLKKLLLAL